MRKNAKSIVAKALVFTLALSVVGIQVPDAEAAKKPKLSAKRVTVTVKKSKKVTIKNVKAKRVKKLTVKTTNKKIATVKRKGKTAFTITGKKAGKTTITAKVKVNKKTTTLKVKVTVKKAAPKPTLVPTAAPTVPPTVAPTTVPTTAPPTAPPAISSSEPSASPIPEPGITPLYTAAPNPGEKRIKGTSDITNPIVDNVSIWGLFDNPYAEVGYDYTQYGTFSGLFSKWFETKDAFKTIHELFNAQTARSLYSSKVLKTESAPGLTPSPVGTKAKEVYATVTTGKINYETKEESEVETHTVEFQARTNDEQPLLEVVSDPVDTTAEAAVLITDRLQKNWHGVQIDVTDYVKDQTKDYRITVDVSHKNSQRNNDDFYVQMCYVNENGIEDKYPVLVMENGKANEWTTLSCNYSSKNTNPASYRMAINWYGNTSTYDDFYVKNIKIMEIKSDKVADASDAIAMNSLYANTEKNYGFSMGGVMTNSDYQDANYRGIINKHFSSFTPGNDLKMYSLLDEKATMNNSVANGGDGMPVLLQNGDGEEVVKWAYENGLGVRGHTLICDTAMSTNCEYFFHEDYDVNKPVVSREVMLQRLESFITQSIQYFEEKYPGTIYTWDLVNEAIETSAGGYEENDLRKIQIKDNRFYDVIGSDYVEHSFLYARKAINELQEMYPKRNVDIKLYYNDFNCYQPSKRNAICKLVESIQKFGAEHNMGNLIDGVGMQCYLGLTGEGADSLNTSLLQASSKKSVSSIPNAIFMFNSLGCNVQITELTVRNYDSTKSTEHADYYKKFMQMIIGINNGSIKNQLN